MDAHLAIRWLHVVAATVLLGGALTLAAGAPRGERSAAASAHYIEAAARYEWLFWSALGVVIAAGVGNLGAYGEGLPPPDSLWGSSLQLKLVLVLATTYLSIVRTLVVVRLRTRIPEEARFLLSLLYGLTAVLLVAVVGLAELLAHG
jgi:hypothetical protein